MTSIFDDASKATEDLFAMEGQEAPAEEVPVEEAPAEAVPTDEVPPETVPAEEAPAEEVPAVQENATPEQAMLDEATQTAEVAAQAAAERDAQLQQVLQEMEAMRQQNAQLQGTIEELSRQNEEQIIEEALEPPVLDISSLAFADEDTIREAQAKYATDMAAYNRNSFMKEFAPVIEQANKAKYNDEKNETIEALSHVPELQGIKDMLPQLDRIIANNKALSASDVPLDEKYITAYAIARGVNSINTPPVEQKDPTAEELMGFYNSNPEFQEMVEKHRLAQVKDSQQVPPFSASSGAVNAALNIKEEPKGWDDASERTLKMFGLS